ncbi:hypothetical protein [Parasitella parasitica]|uniref:Tc1-like transposase DDE domain-containing protein n=1 Tax=Parasitella parasitica TaxID=35722 RepID=A0A0B7NBR1_9FUNG|nr:hypothetical protein [Parasitella parasitica]
MNQYEEFRGHYLIMDNCPIHNHVDIRKYIESHGGYECVYLPPYSPELNPIEQFWSVCKSKIERSTFEGGDIIFQNLEKPAIMCSPVTCKAFADIQ